MSHLECGSLTDLYVCFSRDPPETNPGGAKYVTDLMRLEDNQRKISELITKQSAYVYVCGDATNMAKDVSQAITDILKTQNGEITNLWIHCVILLFFGCLVFFFLAIRFSN